MNEVYDYDGDIISQTYQELVDVAYKLRNDPTEDMLTKVKKVLDEYYKCCIKEIDEDIPCIFDE